MNNQFKALRFDELSFKCISDVNKPYYVGNTCFHVSQHSFTTITELFRYTSMLEDNGCTCVFDDHFKCQFIHCRNYLESGVIHSYVVLTNLIHSFNKNI